MTCDRLAALWMSQFDHITNLSKRPKREKIVFIDDTSVVSAFCQRHIIFLGLASISPFLAYTSQAFLQIHNARSKHKIKDSNKEI
mmetsp:Transcript_18108/g.25378  ORF Transcript_18108/g.25378 Transcript_18108/m.25378 type:complete len:85 (+) Transcript_18108:1457-1711(+)